MKAPETPQLSNPVKSFLTPAPEPATREEMIAWFADNYTPDRDQLVIDRPTTKEVEALTKTKSGIYTGIKAEPEDFRYTVLAVGPEVTSHKPGDKIIINAKTLPCLIMNDYVVSQISRFQIYGTFKK